MKYGVKALAETKVFDKNTKKFVGEIDMTNWTCPYPDEQDTEPIQSLDTTPDTRRINVELINNDAVNHPSHYCEGRKYEPLDVIIDWDLNMCKGTALKYISRAGRKDKNKEIEDLEKAIFYLNREIKRLKDEMVNQTPSAPI